MPPKIFSNTESSDIYSPHGGGGRTGGNLSGNISQIPNYGRWTQSGNQSGNTTTRPAYESTGTSLSRSPASAFSRNIPTAGYRNLPGSTPNKYANRAENTPPLSGVNFNNPFTNQYIKSASSLSSVPQTSGNNFVPQSQNIFPSGQAVNPISIGGFSPYEQIDDLSPKTLAESEDLNRFIGEDVSAELDSDDETFLNGHRIITAIENLTRQTISEPEYPFTGGQSIGISYRVTLILPYQVQYFQWAPHSWYTTLNNISGPIHGIRVVDDFIYLYHANTRILLHPWTITYLGQITSGAFTPDLIHKIHEIQRTDGQPDTGGNPPPIVPEVIYTPVLNQRKQQATAHQPIPFIFPDTINQIVSGVPKTANTQEVLSGLSDYSDDEIERILDEYGIEAVQERLSEGIRRADSLDRELTELNQQLAEVNERLKTEEDNRVLDGLKNDIERQITRAEADKQVQRELFGRLVVDANQANQSSSNPLLNPATIATTGLALGAISTGANINPFGGSSPAPSSSGTARVPQATGGSPNNVIQFPKTPQQTQRETTIDEKTSNQPKPFTPTPESCQNSDDPTTQCIGNIERKLDGQKGLLDSIRDFFKDRLDTLLNALNAFLSAFDTGLLLRIDNKLGAQLPGGLSGFLTDVFSRLWNSRIVDRALNIIGVAASIHNALMLSRNIGETLGSIISNVLGIFGVKDPEATTDKIGQVINGTIENFIKSIVGTENYASLTRTWKTASSIYHSATRLYQLTFDSLYAVQEGISLLGERTGKIGNALRKSGILLENTLDWMSEKTNIRFGRANAFDKLVKGLQVGEELADDLEEITSNFREATENVTEMTEEWNRLTTELDNLTETKKTEETQAKTDSQGANVVPSNLIKPIPDPPANPT